MSSAASVTGFYGKLPAHGDFINRGVPMGVVTAWTNWLDRSLAMARHALGDYWLPTYLSSPPWRFVVDPGVLADTAVAGVLASSVDKVRRTYPVAVFHSLAPGLRLRGIAGAADGAFAALEAAIFEAIEGRIDAEQLLVRVQQEAGGLSGITAPESLEQWRHPAVPALLIGQGRPGLGVAERVRQAGGDRWPATEPICCWWQDGWGEEMPPTVIVSRGLPSADQFVGFLDGRWADRGWSKAGR